MFAAANMRNWFGVVGIVGDADIVCVPCARKIYGAAAITHTIHCPHCRPKDGEGNDLGVILAGTEDQLDIDAPTNLRGEHPYRRCSKCGEELS